MSNAYDVVMNPERNPLQRLRPARKFQIMTYLSLMWSTIFCAALGSWLYYGHLVVAHMLLAAGMVVTLSVFSSARKLESSSERSNAGYRSAKRADGTAKYDDVWGA